MRLKNIHINGKEVQLGEYDGFVVYEGAGLKQDTFYVLCPYGIGDTLYAASLIKSLKESKALPFQKVCLIVKEGHAQIPDWFDAVDEKMVSNEMVEVLNTYSIVTQTWELKNYLYGHFHKSAENGLCPEYAECEVKNMIYRYKKLVFHLPTECQLEEPKILPRWELLEAITKEYEIGKQSIILMPYANSTQLIADEFWELLVARLRKLGYKLFTNVNGKDELPLKGTRGLCVDIATIAALCERCRLVISLRSGLCDVLAFTDTKLVVLNNSEYHSNEWDLNAAVERPGIYSFLMSEPDVLSSVLGILSQG